MYVIIHIATQETVCADASMRTPKLAWDFFQKVCWNGVHHEFGGRVLDWSAGEQRQLFECRLVGTRAAPARVAGHTLSTRDAGAEVQGKCSCGAWTENGPTQGTVQSRHREHLEAIGVDLTPRPAENLSAKDRVAKSLNKLTEEGGARKTFRLPKPAIEELDRMVNVEKYPDHTSALTSVLLARKPVLDENSALYARHVDDKDVEEVIEDAVHALCRELDGLFPGASPDGGKGVGSNFQGLMVEHVKAMLTGKNQARRSHHTHLPVLLADDYVFGQPFALPDVQGAGYVVVSPTDNKVLSAYSNRFVPAFRGREGEGIFRRMVPVFDIDKGGILPADAPVTAYAGKELHFQFEADILFSTYEAATQAALKALHDEEESPASVPLKIVAASYVCEKDCFVLYGR